MRIVLGIWLAVCGCSGSGDETPADAAPDGADAAPDASPDADLRRRLSQEGLYDDFESQTINPAAIEFEPAHVLWSDGALKRRWILLPDGEEIDTSDPDAWSFPVGTKLFKEFRAPDGTLLETRLIERVGPGDDWETDYFMGAFVWEADDSEAFFDLDGQNDVRGTDHDVPAQPRCNMCHRGEPGKILGLSAVQLATDPGALATRLSDPPAPFVYPGTALDAEAMGYLHANCGHCHNPRGSAWADTEQVLRLGVADSGLAITETQLYQSTVDVPFQRWNPPVGVTARIVPGSPEASGVWFRMTQRNNADAMPPIATEQVDDAAVTTVGDWITNL